METDFLQEFVKKHGVESEFIEKPETQQTLKAHEQLTSLGFNVKPEQMIKALVCIPTEIEEPKTKAIIALVSGTDKLDLKVLAELLGEKRVIISDQKTAESISGFERGGTPPIGHATQVPIIMDERLYSESMLYGGGGRTDRILKITPKEIEKTAVKLKIPFLVSKIALPTT